MLGEGGEGEEGISICLHMWLQLAALMLQFVLSLGMYAFLTLTALHALAAVVVARNWTRSFTALVRFAFWVTHYPIILCTNFVFNV